MKNYKYRKTFTFEGKRYSVRADTKEELYSKIALKKRDLEEGRVILSGATSVSEWTNRALNVYKSNLKNFDNMKLVIDKHILSYIGALPLKSIKPIQLQELLKKQSGMSFSHVKSIHDYIKFIFRTAKDNDLILSDPSANLVMPDYTKGHRRSITDDEREHLLNCFKNHPRDFRIFELMLYCGCRPMEAAGVESEDFQEIKGQPMLHIRGTKTVNSDRWVPCPSYIWDKRPQEGLYAPNARTARHTKSSYSRISNRLKREMNIDMGAKLYRNQLIGELPLAEDFVPYCLRHTYCTDLARAGVDVRIAQKLMGHASIQITADIYTHIDNDDILTAASLINLYNANG